KTHQDLVSVPDRLLRVAGQPSFLPEPELLIQAPGRRVVGVHGQGQLFHAYLPSPPDALRQQRRTDPPTSPVGRDRHPEGRDVPGHRMLLPGHGELSDDLGASNGYQVRLLVSPPVPKSAAIVADAAMDAVAPHESALGNHRLPHPEERTSVCRTGRPNDELR